MGLELAEMGIAERVKALIDASGLQQKEVAARAGVPQSSLSRLTTASDADPRISTLLPIARVLKASLDSIVREDEPLPESVLTPYDTNPAYRRLIDALEGLSSRDRSRFFELADWIISARRGAPAEGNVLEFIPARGEKPKEMDQDELRHVTEALGEVVEWRKGALWKEYEVPLVATVSAGSGIEIFEMYEKVRQIPEYYWKAGARAVFKVRGQSMLDMGITDNDLLFVRPTEKPRSGEVIICSLNGAALVKEFERSRTGQVRLVSHNPEYQPMVIGEADDLRVFGVVVGRTGNLMGARREPPSARTDVELDIGGPGGRR